MTTLPTTSREVGVRGALLDVLHAQWRDLGVPFESPLDGAHGAGDGSEGSTRPVEVIDPEALLWCSFAFFGEEPRLEEGVRSWFAANRPRINTQRLNTLARRHAEDPAESARIAAWRSLAEEPRQGTRPHVGEVAPGAASLHLRSRDVLGNGCGAFLLVTLLGSPRGARLRDVARATGYAYRSIADVATGWARAGLVRFERGFCTLLDPSPWTRILRCEPTQVVTVDWQAAYAAVIGLLRQLERARAAQLADGHPLVASAAATAESTLRDAAAGLASGQAPAIDLLCRAIRGG